MTTLSSYLQKWKLILSTNKTMSAVFDLYNREGGRIKLDKALTFRRHLESLRKKLTNQLRLLRRLAIVASKAQNDLLTFCAVTSSVDEWGASATISRTATLAFAHSTVEYSTFVWCCGVYTYLIDNNDNFLKVTG